MAAAILRGSSRALAAAVDELYLGIDLSTQGIKVVGVCAADVAHPVASYAVNFERDFPQYGTRAGVLYGAGGVARAPTLMWVAALDKALGGLRDAGFAFSRVAAVSGAAQQHATVRVVVVCSTRCGVGVTGSAAAGVPHEGHPGAAAGPGWQRAARGGARGLLRGAELARLDGQLDGGGDGRTGGGVRRRGGGRPLDWVPVCVLCVCVCVCCGGRPLDWVPVCACVLRRSPA